MDTRGGSPEFQKNQWEGGSGDMFSTPKGVFAVLGFEVVGSFQQEGHLFAAGSGFFSVLEVLDHYTEGGEQFRGVITGREVTLRTGWQRPSRRRIVLQREGLHRWPMLVGH
eukprot:8551487-Ditylum_brightwellii.AAC.1